jgi:phosphoribosylformylglycinamidine (FGAM) synthase-like amidotransferase family enzyme
MNIYRIIVEHAGGKSNHTSIECYLLAENDEAVFEWIDKEKNYDGWWHNDNDDNVEPYNIYDNNYNVVGTETYKERMLRLKGEINDEDRDYSDSYYGLKFFGWSLVKENPLPVEINVLKELDMIIDITSSAR